METTYRLVLDFSLPLPRAGEGGGALSMSLKGWVWSGLTVSLKMGGAGSRWIPAVVSRAGVEGPGLKLGFEELRAGRREDGFDSGKASLRRFRRDLK